MDAITINSLEVWTHIGVPDDERRSEQRLLVTLTLHLDLKAAGKADDVTKSVDYRMVRDCILALAATERKTVERFAEDCADAVLSRFPCNRIDVTVRKFPFPQARSVDITVSRP